MYNKEMQEMYRMFLKARMKECICDAEEILKKSDYSISDMLNLAISFFDKRVSPYYYWETKQKVKNMEVKNDR